MMSSKNRLILSFLKNSFKSVQILVISGEGGVGQKVRPFSRAWTCGLVRLRLLRLTTEKPNWLSLVSPGARMPLGRLKPDEDGGGSIIKRVKDKKNEALK